jgi:hypothetical protein
MAIDNRGNNTGMEVDHMASDNRRNNTGMAFIVGGLVVAVGIIAYLIFGNSVDDRAGTTIGVETQTTASPEAPATAPAESAPGTGSTDNATTDTTTTTTTTTGN